MIGLLTRSVIGLTQKNLHSLETLQNIFQFDEAPLTFWGMAWRYALFGPIYAMYRTTKLSLTIFIIALISIIALTAVAGIAFNHSGVSFISTLLVWTISTLIVDIFRRKKFMTCCNLWAKLVPHPQLAEKNNIFADSKKILTYSSKSWTLVIPILLWLFLSLMFAIAFEIEPVQQQNIPVNQITNDRNDNVGEDNFIPQSDEHSTSQVEKENSTNTVNPQQSSNLILTHTDFGKAFANYYGAINNKQYGQAYSHLTEKCRSRMGSLANFAEGRRNTLSVEIIDFQQVAASTSQVNCNYKIRAKDNDPNGILVQEFFGNVTLVKLGHQWFIDEIASSLVNSHIE